VLVAREAEAGNGGLIHKVKRFLTDIF
jgi:hypothetical protein